MTTGSFQLSDLIEHSAWVERLARSLVRDPDAAEELVQETWLRTLRNPPRSSSSPRSRRAFLGRVVRNLIRQRAREERHRRGREEAHARPETLPAAADLVAAVDSQRALVEEVLGLPAEQRDTLLLRYFQDLTSAEIARRTGESSATVRSRLKRGLAELRARLDRKAGGDANPRLMALILAAPSTISTTSKAPIASAPLSLPALLMSKSHLALAVFIVAVVCGVAGIYRLSSNRTSSDTEVARSERASSAAERGSAEFDQRKAGKEHTQLAQPSAPEVARVDRGNAQRSDAPARRGSGAAEDHFQGRVVDLDGHPVPEAMVWIGPAVLIEADAVESVRLRGPEALANAEPVDPTSAVETDVRGHFDFDETPADRVTLWAKRSDSRYGWTSLPATRYTTAIEIVVELIPRERRIAGVVQDATGEPYPDARVTYSVVDERGSAQSSGVALDDEGRFDIEVALRGAYDLVADDPHADPARPMRAYANRVEPGTVDLVLRLGEAPILNVQVRDAAGAPIEDVRITPMIGSERSSVSVGSYPGPHPAGLVELPLPGRPFYLQLRARGYHDERLGPLDPVTIRRTLEVELRRAPRVTGVVLANGQPIAGARVGLYRPNAPGMRVQIDGYTVNFSPDGATVTTDMDGRFELVHRHGAPYRVLAQHDEYAAADSGTLELGVDEERLDLTLELAEGGTLVVHAPEGTAEGETIVAHCGMGAPRRALVDANGVATFRRIASGRWYVQLEDDELRSWRGSVQKSSGDPESTVERPWNCEIRAGKTETVKL